MSYQIILDILGATILGGTFLLCLRSFQREDRQKNHRPIDELAARENLAAFVALVEEDLRQKEDAAARTFSARPVMASVASDAYLSIPDRISPLSFVNPIGETCLDFKYRRYEGEPALRPVDPSRARTFDGIELTLRVKNQTMSAAETVDSRELVNASQEQLAPETKYYGYLNP